MTLREEKNCKHLFCGSLCGIQHVGLIRRTQIYYRFMNCTDCIDEGNANCPYRSGRDFRSMYFNVATHAWEDIKTIEMKRELEKILTMPQIKEYE